MRLSFARGAAGLVAGLVAGLSVAPSVVSAQPGGVSAACTLDPNSPKELAVMELQYQRARSASTPEVRQSALKAMIKELDTKPERFAKNPGGYQLRIAQTLAMWAVEPGIGYTPLRSALGYITTPTETIDLIQKLDETYKAIAAAVPSCESDVKALRQNEVWLALTRRALDASNGGQLDTAEIYAKRSLLMSAENPYPYYVLGNVANQKKDRAAAMAAWKMVVSTAAADTSYRELKNSSMYLLSVNLLEAAEGATGAEQQKTAKEAATAFKALLGAMPDSPDVPNIMQSWSDAMRMAGDSANIPSIYTDMLAKPAGYTEAALTMAGVIATRINKMDDALGLFGAATSRSAAAHDALRNLASTYYGKEQFTKMFEPLNKFVALDPNNYDGWMMFAYASQGLAKAVQMPPEPKKGAVVTPAQRAAMETANAARKAWNDSTLKYMNYAEALPVKVEVVTWQRGAKDASVTLKFEQAADAVGNYTVTVEFLDAAGKVVGTAANPVGPIKKGESKNVVFKATATDVAGYRYNAIK